MAGAGRRPVATAPPTSALTRPRSPLRPCSPVLAWLVAWTYVLPWYDSLAWALLAMLPWLPMPWAALDWLVLARTTVLAFGYLPARGIALPPGLDWTRTVIRTGVTPVLLLGTAVLLVLVLRSGGRERNAS